MFHQGAKLLYIVRNYASPNNRAREVFLKKVKPQLDFNNSALRKKLAKNSVDIGNGAVKYQIDIRRLDYFLQLLHTV